MEGGDTSAHRARCRDRASDSIPGIRLVRSLCRLGFGVWAPEKHNPTEVTVLSAALLRSHRPVLLATVFAVALAPGAITGGAYGWNMVAMTWANGFTCSATGSSATNTVPVTGATSNGSSDDYNAIQKAIDSAGRRGGGIVTLPAGTFMTNRHLVLKNNVKLTGVGPATIIKAGPGFLSTQAPYGGYPIITTAGASDATIADLTADQSGEMLNGNVSARLTGYVVEGRDSSNVVVDGVYVRNPFTYSIAMVGSTDFCVENSNVMVTTSGLYNQLDGIHILASNSGQVIDNTIVSGDDGLVAHSIGAAVFNILYANNKVYGGATDAGFQLAVGDFPIYGITIEDNNFYGSYLGIHTGYYDNRTGALYNVAISGNYIHDLSRGAQSFAIHVGGLGAYGSLGGLGPIDNVVVSNNQVCNAGPISLQAGPGNVVTGTTGC
jgi:polygalacturonase